MKQRKLLPALIKARLYESKFKQILLLGPLIRKYPILQVFTANKRAIVVAI